MPKTFKIYTLGCKVNQYDSGSLARRLAESGFGLTKDNADLAVVNSCAVTNKAIRKARSMIKKAKAENPGARIVLTGCWAKIVEARVFDPAVYVINSVEEILELINSKSKILNPKQIQNTKFKISEPLIITEYTESTDKFRLNPKSKILNLKLNTRSRYFLKIQDGCEQFCSYCVIPYTRGKLQSRDSGEVIEEVKRAAAEGCGEVVLCGIHIGKYESEPLISTERTDYTEKLKIRNKKQKMEKTKINLTNLLNQLTNIKNLRRIRLSSIEVTEVDDELIKLMAGRGERPFAHEGKICQHLHIPLQSGRDKILKSMNRPYDIKYYKNKIRKIRRLMPDIAITTDVIVGFPSETEADFKKTYNFIKQLKFSHLHVFPFSAHERTPAAKMPNQVKEKVKLARAKKLRALGVKLASEYKNRFKGSEVEVLVEQARDGKLVGKTEYYFDVKAQINTNLRQINADNTHLVGKIVKVKMQ